MSYTAGPLASAMLGIQSLGRWSAVDARTVVTSTTWATANLARYVPVLIPIRVVIVKLALCNGAAVSGNFDIGIYNAAGTRIVSSGSTAQSGTTSEQVVDVSDTTLSPGLYYFAVNLDNATGRTIAATAAAPLMACHGVLTEAVGSVTLPATATWTVDHTNAYAPQMIAFVEGTVA